MFFSKTFAALALATLAAAQSATLKFTNTDFDVKVGTPFKIMYSTNALNVAATIVLRKGSSTQLTTVETITSDATGGSYLWTPGNLAPADDYAFEITQGNEQNYSEEFSITGGSAASTYSSSFPATYTGSGYTYPTGKPSNASVVLTAPANYSTATYPAASASGTGTISMVRNATFSSPTLRATTTLSQVSGTTTAAAQTSTNAAAIVGKSVTLLFGLMGAMVYLG